MNWSELSLSPEMLKHIEDSGFTHPTPVQEQSLPLILAGHDVLVSSQTGSGKTASFVIPTIERFKNKNGTFILALAPTREIAQQSGQVFEAFGKPFGMKTVVCIGGASIPEEKAALATSPHIIVATPGRLCDHLERGNVWLEFIQCLILDEADRMLEMGFAKQIEMISNQIPKERQTLMFSATFAPKVERLAKSTMKNPKAVTITKKETEAPKIEQDLLWMREEEKTNALIRICRNEPGTIIVFTNQKEKTFRIWRALEGRGIKEVGYINSDIPQEQRESTVADFKSGKFRILIATDVLGRGLDVEDVAHVINYDVPKEAADYVHRIGRTARKGKSGHATTFAIPVRDEFGIRAIEKLLGITSPEAPPKSNDKKFDRKSKDGRKDFKNGPKREARPAQPKEPQRSSTYRPKKPTPPVPQNVVETSEKKSKGFIGWIKSLF